MKAGPDDRGQATVEMALAMPVLAVGLLLIVQAALVVVGAVGTVHAAREAARAVAVDGRPGAADAALGAAGRDGCRAEVTRPAQPGATLTVTVTCPVPTDVALVGPLLPDLHLTTRASMRVER